MNGPTDPLGWLDDVEAARIAAGLRRELHPRASDATMLDLASNDYLGLALDPRVKAAAVEAIREWGTGSTGSRLVTGTTSAHVELDTALARATGAEAGLVFSSGYLANLGAVSALAGEGTLIVSDEHNHASLIDACRLSRAQVVVTPNRDVAAVEQVLAGRPAGQRALVVTDAVFSVDGVRAPVLALHEVAVRHGALLLVDEAHSFGVLGPGGAGLCAEVGIASSRALLMTLTLSKALASQGGAVLGAQPVIAHVVDSARSFIFDTGLAPASVAAASEVLRILANEPGLPAAALDNARRIHDIAVSLGWESPEPEAAVVGVIVGEPTAALNAARACAERGVHVGCFRPPSVPDGRSRLRLTSKADLTQGDFDLITDALAHARKVVA